MIDVSKSDTFCICPSGDYVAITSIGINNCYYPYPESIIQTINLTDYMSCEEKLVINNEWITEDIFTTKEITCDYYGNLKGTILYESSDCLTLYEMDFERN
jgi:hypothetical protein